jgi:hypothetical protein
VSGQKLENGGVIKLTAIICLHGEDGSLKLSLNMSVKGSKNCSDLGFLAKRESPHIVRVVIQDYKVILIA